VPAGALAFSVSRSAAFGRIASSENPHMNDAMRPAASDGCADFGVTAASAMMLSSFRASPFETPGCGRLLRLRSENGGRRDTQCLSPHPEERTTCASRRMKAEPHSQTSH
jgi:hypothetical protein